MVNVFFIRQDFLFGPVLDCQARDSCELGEVIGYYPESVSRCDSRDQKIALANWRLSQEISKPSVFLGGSSLEWQHQIWFEKLSPCFPFSGRIIAFLGAIPKLRNCDA